MVRNFIIDYTLLARNSTLLPLEESVKEALAAEMVPVIWWFFSVFLLPFICNKGLELTLVQHCQVIPDDSPDAMEGFASTSTTATISVQVFTPILATLLLSSNPLIIGAARFAVVDLLTRMSRADERESGLPTTSISPNADDDDEEIETAYAVGLFKHDEREMFRQEILQSVVIGMGKLGDADDSMGQEQNWAGSPMRQVPVFDSNSAQSDAQSPPMSGQSNSPSVPSRPLSPAVNPYFPSAPHPSTNEGSSRPFAERSISPAPASPPLVPPFARGAHPHTQPTLSPGFSPSVPRTPESDQSASLPAFDINQHHRDAEQSDESDDEQAAIGQLSSMSLMAAVTATGKHVFSAS